MLPAHFTHPYDRVGRAGMFAICMLTVQKEVLPLYIVEAIFLR